MTQILGSIAVSGEKELSIVMSDRLSTRLVEIDKDFWSLDPTNNSYVRKVYQPGEHNGKDIYT